MQWLN
jgi:hypothetical protein